MIKIMYIRKELREINRVVFFKMEFLVQCRFVSWMLFVCNKKSMEIKSYCLEIFIRIQQNNFVVEFKN